MNLLPCPRHLQRGAGFFVCGGRDSIHSPRALAAEARLMASRLAQFGFRASTRNRPASIVLRKVRSPGHGPEYHEIEIDANGIRVAASRPAGFRAATATLRQLLREHGRNLPSLKIRDWPDFPRRGFMLDISRGRVPNLRTLLQLAEHLADFKINELQLYTEHTFAYQRHKPVWRDWGAITAREIRTLAARCRILGIDLVPNQNSFGHLREFLAHPPLRHLAEVSAPYPGASGDFLRYPSTLAPTHPGTLPFLRGLYDELLPNFSSDRFNVGCDETWDLGRGRSREVCARKGQGRIYVSFLKSIRREVAARGLRMMFWGDIVLKYPRLIRDLPRDCIALNWGYEADHPFERESRQFARARLPFYVCPGTSTWMTLVGRHDNALRNLESAASAGRRHGAVGYLITDWGDGGHPQPLAVTWLPLLAGAGLAWSAETYSEKLLLPVMSRDLFHDRTGGLAAAALALGKAHLKLGYREPNATPLGAAIAAPPPERRELFCRNGLKYYARIPAKRIESARTEIERARLLLKKSKPRGAGKTFQHELDLAARMAAESCRFMLWQQAVAAGNRVRAKSLARQGISALRRIQREFDAFWPERNKAGTGRCSPFLDWRIDDYRKGVLAFPPTVARKE